MVLNGRNYNLKVDTFQSETNLAENTKIKFHFNSINSFAFANKCDQKLIGNN
jgi:hypothetical protein